MAIATSDWLLRHNCPASVVPIIPCNDTVDDGSNNGNDYGGNNDDRNDSNDDRNDGDDDNINGNDENKKDEKNKDDKKHVNYKEKWQQQQETGYPYR